MAIRLLDVSALIALAWPTHEHHVIAQRWFDDVSPEGWATCPMTQCGFVRLSSNPKIIDGATSPAAALELLQRVTAYPEHVFWSDDIAITDASDWMRDRLRGHQQVTDAYLLALCLKRGGRFATFDRAVSSLARTAEEAQAIEIVSAY